MSEYPDAAVQYILDHQPPAHEHVWVYDHTYEDWWDGDCDDVYYCSVENCMAIDRRYVPR